MKGSCRNKPSRPNRRSNLAEAKADYERAVGRTLEVNGVTVSAAKRDELERETLIPGTPHGQVVGAEKLFSDVPAAKMF